MSIFAIVLDKSNSVAEERIKSEFPHNHKMNDMLYLVTSEEIADKIAHRVGVKSEEEEPIQSGVVFRLNHSYAGFTSRALWDWLEQAEGK